jgi:parallel beta-helix repeat protein
VPVRADLTGRRLTVALLLLSVLPALLVAAAVRYAQPELPPGPPSYSPLALPDDPLMNALQVRELQRSRHAASLGTTLRAPVLLPPRFPDPLSTLTLAPRPTPYTLAELRRTVPAAFGTVGTALLLRSSIEVPAGAHLVVGTATPDVRLLSGPAGFATIIARGGRLDVVGSAARPVHVTSWDLARRAPDREHRDGRSFLLVLGNRMDVRHADVGYLGFGTGTSSGMAWRGMTDATGALIRPATGAVSDSVLHRSWFGAYTFGARNMRWLRNTFAQNSGYGFDPHDFSDGFLVEGNRAFGNGRHGFIFSRGCNRNVLRHNLAYSNRGHGFMIDDGRSEVTTASQAGPVASDGNLLIDNTARDNAGSGVEIEGGKGNVVRGNVITRNHVGVRIKNLASATVEGNQISKSRLYGVDVLRGAGRVVVRHNAVAGGWAGVSLGAQGGAVLDGNQVTHASAPLVVQGARVEHVTFSEWMAQFLRWNPLLVIWTAILWLPALLGAARLLRWLTRLRPSVSPTRS